MNSNQSRNDEDPCVEDGAETDTDDDNQGKSKNS